LLLIKKPKYKKYVISEDELEVLVNQMKEKYESSYPNFKIEISIEPDPKLVKFDGLIKEFTCQAKLQNI
jgi:hypothetical protein